MLKGLKKSKPMEDEQEINRVRPTINETQIKQEQLIDQQKEEEYDAQKIMEHSMRQHMRLRYEECFQYYLGGHSDLVSQKLKEFQQERKAKTNSYQPVSKANAAKFDYNMKFQEDQDGKQKQRKRNKPIMQSNRIEQFCQFCPDNEQLTILSASNYVYLALPKCKTFKNYFHLILAPVDHQQTTIGLNEDVITQINNYKKCLIHAFDKINMHVVFFQQFSKQNSHIYLQCLAMSMAKAEDLPFFFKQSLEDVEGNWNTHKNIIKIEKDKGGLQKQIPKQMKYLYIDFSFGYGYAHVIQNQRFWKRQFCYEVLATALGLESHRVKTTEQFSPEELQVKKQTFSKIWAPFDWTELI